MNKYDVVVVGAGPAGLYCARLLSSHLRVAVITNKEIASHKPCGGLLTRRADAYLKELKIPSSFYCNPAEIEADIFYRGRLTEEHFFNINRAPMERELYNSFMNAVDLFILRRISIGKNAGRFFIKSDFPDDELSCKYLIAADGANSVVRRMLGYERAPVIGVEQQSCGNRIDRVKMVVDASVSKDYYYWMIPKDERMLVGYKTEDRRNVMDDIKYRFGIDLSDEETEYERYIITKIERTEDIQLGGDNAFIIGEAAGLVLPNSGEGLTSAFESAKHAADAVLDTGPEDKNRLYAESMLPRIEILESDLKRIIQ